MEIQSSDDAYPIYQGRAIVHLYGRANNGVQFFTVKDLDKEGFQFVLDNVEPNTPVLFHGGAGSNILMNGWCLKLKKAGDGVRTGPNLRFEFPELDDEAYEIIRSVKESGEELFITVIRGEIYVEETQAKGEHGKFAAKLMTSKLFAHPQFWASVGTETDYFSWLRTQPCCITGRMDRNTDKGEDFTEVAHVSSVKYGKGIGHKTPYFAVPMLQKQHRFCEHQNGIVKVWENSGRKLPKGIHYPISSDVDVARYFFELEALRYIREWLKEKIKKDLNIPSLSYCSEERFNQYLKQIGCEDLWKFI